MFRLLLHPAALDVALDVARDATIAAPPRDDCRPRDARPTRVDRDSFWSILRDTLEATAGR
jgi:hypothetical protein